MLYCRHFKKLLNKESEQERETMVPDWPIRGWELGHDSNTKEMIKSLHNLNHHAENMRGTK